MSVVTILLNKLSREILVNASKNYSKVVNPWRVLFYEYLNSHVFAHILDEGQKSHENLWFPSQSGNIPNWRIVTANCCQKLQEIQTVQLTTCFHKKTNFKLLIRLLWIRKKNTGSDLIKNGILLPKLFWPTVRKNCSCYREKTFLIRG